MQLTDGTEKAESLTSSYISLFFVEKAALEHVELIREVEGSPEDHQRGGSFIPLHCPFFHKRMVEGCRLKPGYIMHSRTL